MKKSIISFILGALLFGAIGVYAGAQYVAEIAPFKVFVNGEEFQGTTGEILTVEGRTYLPLRDMGNALGIAVNWNDELGQVEVGTPPNNQTESEQPVLSTTSKISAPGEGSKYDSVIPGGFCFRVNSADGVEVSWIAKNNTGKAIKYYHLNFAMYNAVGDPAYCTIKKAYKITTSTVGPVEPGQDLLAYKDVLGYTAVCSKIVLESIDIEYMDNTEEHIEYWYDTTTKIRK